MQLTINGKEAQTAAGTTVARLVAELGFAPGQVAVERNRGIVPRSGWEETVLCAGDAIEIVQFIGGG